LAKRSDRAVGNLEDSLLDEYLEFCQQALVGQQQAGQPGKADDIVRDHFPIEHYARGEATAEVKKSPRTGVRAGKLVSGLAEEKAVRPGENYAIWNSRDVFGTLAKESAAAVGWGAKRVGIGEGYLGEVVEAYERRFVRWWEGERRREKGEDENRDRG
jgi:RNA polymerase I-specific transcription initiation factor RRN7